MAEVLQEEFKTTLMGGYDKEDVHAKFKALEEKEYAEKSKLNQEIQRLKEQVEEKDRLLEEKKAQIEQLNRDIEEKYQTYIDNYDIIGKLVYETRIKSEKALNEANEERDRILEEANKKAKLTVKKAKDEMEKSFEDGKRRYGMLQDEVNELIQMVNQVQHKFMQSFKAIHEISGAMNENAPAELVFGEEETSEEEMQEKTFEDEVEEESFDEEFDEDEEEDMSYRIEIEDED